ncbi:SET domain-containing protein 3 [Diplogelasinospora grovesii]|uniref:SET domain-containing protein 3 n=1 Tax=Diplogelasinospora grovesii TaxID=303347 RepID=A0AAN6NIX4_9PEZI|nr:SET domain-containing protein 3 [Diplogelasinospora grovesii]
MTDKLPPLSTPIAPPSHIPYTLPPTSSVQDVAQKQEIAEEEPYTIKCICNFTDDDGNTIYCEKCDTWQHIECYYPDNVEDALREDFSHSCAECDPRSLDRQQAIERQKARTTAVPVVEEEATDKKPKRPPSKSHKKKPKPTDLQQNGHHPSSENTKHPSLPDHPHPHPPKKTKNSHKPTQSISSQAPKRSPSYGGAKVNPGRPPSPATTPPDLPDDLEIHNYSSGFLTLYNDNDVQIVHTNSFAGLQVSNAMSEWLRDPAKMQKETGWSYHDVFQKLPPNANSSRRLDVEVTKKALPNTTLQWQYLKAPSAIGKDVPLMELNGQVGFQAIYCADPENRWNEFTSPLPFVLFHPYLPLYIDTRREGSEARFVRRSCRPNAVLETYLSDTSEYHFWLVSDRQIAAKEQITIPWDFRFPKDNKARMLRILGLGDDETSAQPEPTIDEIEYQSIAGWVHLVLSEHGGCACNLGTECAFARFHKNYYSKAQTRTNPPKSKKRKPKAQQHTISPTSTGHATNSRAASEGHLEDVPEHDGRSVSGSSRSKPPSRDLTPTARQGSFDTLGILTEPTDRDKRKVTMIEDSFRRMEQQQHQPPPPRKRKRVSDGTTSSKSKTTKSASSAVQTPTLVNGFSERHYVDAGTSRSKSGSPASPASTLPNANRLKPLEGASGSAPTASRAVSVAGRPSTYIDAEAQTDPEERAWYEPSSPMSSSTPRRRIVSLSRRLLDNRHRLRLDQDEKRKRQSLEQDSAPSTVMDVDSPTSQNVPLLSPELEKEVEKVSAMVSSTPNGSMDTPMPDAPTMSPMASPTDGTASAGLSTTGSVKNKSPDLRVQMPPPSSFESPTSALSTATTPLSAGSSMIQSPFSAGVTNSFAGLSVNHQLGANPSPIKKKLSLSDYTKSRMNKAAAGRTSIGTTQLKPVSSSEDPKSATSVELESPTATTATSIGTATTTEKVTESPTTTMPPPLTNGSAV